jgi:type I protein arginine methyltransferase
VEDLDFCSAYSLIIKHKTYFHGLVTWFAAYFSKDQEAPVVLNTSPFGKATHWKQTLFYLVEPFGVMRDEKVVGSIAVVKSKENKRELNVRISFKGENHKTEQFFKLS